MASTDPVVFEIERLSNTTTKINMPLGLFLDLILLLFELQAQEIDKAGAPVNSMTTAMVTVSVEDVNDNAPQFSQPQYTAEIQENMQNGVPITFLADTMRVSDADQVPSHHPHPHPHPHHHHHQHHHHHCLFRIFLLTAASQHQSQSHRQLKIY
jgi:hypothetical protein